MHLANVSNKNVVVMFTYTTDHGGVGSYYAEVEREYTAPLRESGEFIPRGGETLAPSTTRDLLLGMDASQCAAPVIDVVVYADDTAEVVNEDAFRHYILPMEEKVLTLKKENEIIAQFASSQSRVADTVGELHLPDISSNADFCTSCRRWRDVRSECIHRDARRARRYDTGQSPGAL
jgi:hypothetical protein